MSAQGIDVDDVSGKDPWPDPPPPPPPPPWVAHPAGQWAAHTSAYGPAGSGHAEWVPAVTVIHDA